MEEIVKPVKKPSGCLQGCGCLLVIGSLLFIAFCVAMTVSGEEHLDELRAEYAASQEEYEQAMEAYDADSVHMQAEYNRIQTLIDEAEAAGDSALVASLTDSLTQYDVPVYEPRGAIGVNIGGAFFLFFSIIAMIPLLIGVGMIIYHRRRKQQYKKNKVDEKTPI